MKNKKEKIMPKKCVRDEQGRVIIPMVVKDDTNFLSVFSANDTPIISQDVAEFITNSTGSVRPGQPLSLHIKSNCINDEEKLIYEKAIHEYYTEKYVANKRELLKNYIVALILAMIGIAVLTVAILLEKPIWSEVIDIAAWVFLWEAVDIAFFEMRKIKRDNKRCLSLIDMPIHYTDI